MSQDARKPITGKVASILNARELAINRGSSDGVRVGMKFDVVDPKGENIKDPDTGRTLGSLRRSKIRVEVSRVADEHLSLAQTKSYTVNVGGDFGLGRSFGALSRMYLPEQYETRYETLKRPKEGREKVEEEESYIEVGDPVEEVIEEEKPKARTTASVEKFVDKLVGEEPGKSR